MLKGFHRISCGIPKTHVGNPKANASEIAQLYRRAAAQGAAVLLTPELSLTGSTCGDLFGKDLLLDEVETALEILCDETRNGRTLLVVGLPLRVRSRVFNAVCVLQDGKILGVSAKTALRNAAEHRFFRSAAEHDGDDIRICGMDGIPFGNDLIFQDGMGLAFACEFLDDMRAVAPTSNDLCLQGATLLLCPAAEPDFAGSADARRNFVSAHAERLACCCCVANAGCHESTSSAVYAGEAFVCEEGDRIAEGKRFERENQLLSTEVNSKWLEHDRRNRDAFLSAVPLAPARFVELLPAPVAEELKYRNFSATPFVPADAAARTAWCQEVLRLQATALAHRVEASHAKAMVVGLSGGLDSTLALLVCCETADLLGLPRDFITVITMPGMGTTSRTHDNAADMARALKTAFREIPIGAAVQQHFRDIGHDPANLNVVYENAQARERTQILMDVANELCGMVVGTCDLSEDALGWCTYNGDHMSMYSLNNDVPKSLIRAIVEDYAARTQIPELSAVLRDINATPVSPELLPGGTGTQKTEKILGSYTLHDFILYHFLKHGETPENLLALAQNTFAAEEFPEEELKNALALFFRRFMTQQFKRNCAPDGPKVLDVAIGSHEDWVMPSDVEYHA